MLGMKNNNLLMIDVPFFKIYRNPNVFAINIGITPIVMPYGVTLGKNMSDQSKEIYRSAKTNNEIIKSVTQEKP